MYKSFLQKIRRIGFSDIVSVFLFLIALPISFIYRKRRKKLWLLCEYGEEARDNAFFLFRYLKKEHPEIDAVYAINSDSVDLEKVAAYGEVVYYGSLKHWIYYLSAEVNISSQKGGKPNAAICYFLEVVSGLLKNTRVFLQHGIISNDLPYLHYENAKISMFVTSTENEFEFVCDKFGYPDGSVVLTGLCRYDNLTDISDRTIIGIVPTWREWLYNTYGMEQIEGHYSFKESEFYKMWSSLIERILEHYDGLPFQVVLCLHRNMQQYNDYFKRLSDKLVVVDNSQGDVADVLKRSACLITDYSSVANDFAYLKKPLAYYQADHESFFNHHLPTGYFDYKENGFGPVFYTLEETLDWLYSCINAGFTLDPIYKRRAENFFKYNDQSNCERTFNAIKKHLAKECNTAWKKT